MKRLGALALFCACAPARAKPPSAQSEATETPPAGVVVVRTIEGIRVQIDRRRQVLAVDIPEENGGSEPDTPLAARLPFGRWDRFLPASVLAAKAKQFDDGLYAAVEIAAQSGGGRLRRCPIGFDFPYSPWYLKESRTLAR